MSRKILVIDDDPTSNTLVGFLLKTNGYDVVTSPDGADGLKQADKEKPDLIVLDVMMPKMDGYTFLRELKRINYLKNLSPSVVCQKQFLRGLTHLRWRRLLKCIII